MNDKTKQELINWIEKETWLSKGTGRGIRLWKVVYTDDLLDKIEELFESAKPVKSEGITAWTEQQLKDFEQMQQEGWELANSVLDEPVPTKPITDEEMLEGGESKEIQSIGPTLEKHLSEKDDNILFINLKKEIKELKKEIKILNQLSKAKEIEENFIIKWFRK